MITFYKVSSLGGMEGRTWETKFFETEDIARENALKDKWNVGHFLIKCIIDKDKMTEIQIGNIPNGRSS